MTSSRWPWLTLIACAAASGNAVAQAPAEPSSQPEQAAEGEQASEREWRLPPLRMTGTLGYSARVTASKGSVNTSHVVTGTFGVSTYIYQPWVATVEGSLGLSQSWFMSKTSDPAAVGAPGDTDWLLHKKVRSSEQFITGQGTLSLFNRSRFPAEITLDRQDSRSDSGLQAPAIHWRQQGITLLQRYRPPDGAYSVSTTLLHREQEGAGASGRQYGISGEFATRWERQDIGLSGSYSRALGTSTGDDSRFTTLVARHSYLPTPALSLHTTANATRNVDKGFGDSDLQTLQVSSVGMYNPVGSPLALTGTARAFVFRDALTDAASQSVGATAGASYRVNENMQVTASGGAGFSSAGGEDSALYSLAGGVSYQGDPIRWREIQYDWFAGASAGGSLGQRSSAETDTQQNLSMQMGHTLSRNWLVSTTSSFSVTASQGLSAAASRSSAELGLRPGWERSTSLQNTVSANWQSSGDGRAAYVRTSYSDALQLGGRRDRFQMFNVQLSGNVALGTGRTLSGDLTYQWTQQRSVDPALEGLPASGSLLRTRSSGASGEITFSQDRLFGVPRLQFHSRLRLARDVLKQPGQLLSIPDRETKLWENRLDWSIGRLQAQMSLHLSEFDGQRVGSVWLNLRRSFGN